MCWVVCTQDHLQGKRMGQTAQPEWNVIISKVTAALLVHECSGCLTAWWSSPCGQHPLEAPTPTWRKHRLRGWPAHL